MHWFRTFVCGSVTLLLCGCGYAFQGSGSILPPDVKTVAVPLVENDTSEQGLDIQLTEALRSRFERYGAVKVITNPALADAVLTAKVVRLTNRVRNVTGSTDIALQMDLLMTVSATLKRKNGQILWRNDSVNAVASYANVSGLVVTSSTSFAQGGIGADTLSGLDSREVSRGQQAQVLADAVDSISQKIYADAVAAEF